jgi:signal transduction histidine kinase
MPSLPSSINSSNREVLSLLRLSLLLRLLPGTVIAIRVARSFAINTSLPLLPLISISLTAGVLAIVWLALRRGWASPQHVRMLLFLSIVAYALETLLPALLIWSGAIQLPAAAYAPNRTDDGGAAGFFAISLFFTLIPAVLGAWLGGRRGVFMWVAISVLVNIVNFAAISLVTQTLQPQLGLTSDLGAFVAQAVIFSIVCFFVASLADRQRAEQHELERANTQLREQAHVREQLAAGRERMNISRDLHDTVAHSLAALSVQLNAVEATLATPEQAKAQLAIAKTLVRDGLTDTRQAVAGLRLDAVHDLGLIEALRRHVDSVNRRGRVEVQFNSDPDTAMLPLPDATADAFFRIVQEALNNAEKHANATRVRVSLHHREDHLDLSVRDDGVGFDQAALDSDRFGLRGMRERAEMIGAHLSVKSAPGSGTTVLVTLDKPVPA